MARAILRMRHDYLLPGDDRSLPLPELLAAG